MSGLWVLQSGALLVSAYVVAGGAIQVVVAKCFCSLDVLTKVTLDAASIVSLTQDSIVCHFRSLRARASSFSGICVHELSLVVGVLLPVYVGSLHRAEWNIVNIRELWSVDGESCLRVDWKTRSLVSCHGSLHGRCTLIAFIVDIARRHERSIVVVSH